jgi:hypothetical protein
MQAYEDCPRKWSMESMFEGPRMPSKYAAIGTAVHSVVENHFRGTMMLKEEREQYLAAHGVNTDEIVKCLRYIDLLKKQNVEVGVLEHEFTLPLIPIEGAKQVRGHMDLIGVQNGVLTIVDHKTNRQLEPVAVWKHKLQTRIYSMAAREIWKANGVDTVRFIIGYVNLGEFVTWETTAADDVETKQRMMKIWDELVEYCKSQKFEERLCDVCKWCSVSDTCATFQNSVVNFKDSVADLMTSTDDYEKYSLLTLVKKLVDNELDKIKERLIDTVRAAGGSVKRDGQIYELTQGSRRNIKFSELWPVLQGHMIMHPEFENELVGYYNDMFTAKVGGVDDLLKMYPELKAVIEPHIVRVMNEEGISVKKIGETKKITK